MIKLNTKYLIVIVAMLFTSIGFTQEDDVVEEEIEIKEDFNMLFNSVIEMDVDKSIFTMSQGNSHFTEDQKSGIVAMLVPSSFEKLEKDLKNELSKEGTETLDKGELKDGDKRILFLKQSMEREGQTFYILMFAKEHNDEASIMVTAFYESNQDATFKKHGEKAIKSAKLVEKE
ncbi:hypothetical protein [uncultured Psychroserpens sp.]|uniref:hypothetical protein n=1 Tax=uncultured Psychroserpens sp. TaxID=255436 RepID=UPI00260AC514|nr:hypothetical protein [uncultured Psychroserpens sp.]